MQLGPVAKRTHSVVLGAEPDTGGGRGVDHGLMKGGGMEGENKTREGHRRGALDADKKARVNDQVGNNVGGGR